MVQFVKTKSEFDTIIASGVTFVDFTASWCGPCQFIGPKFIAFAEQYEGKVKCIKVDVDDAQDIAMAEKVSAMPTFKVYKDGVKVDELVGADVNGLQKLFEKYSA
eukprot:m.240045 g.240045  ORF g.240045 m.240045 type:complete len:105 (-) comp14409_c0_seq1:338-652(-)